MAGWWTCAVPAQVREWTLLSEVGAALVPQNPIVEMGLFTEELRKKELLRDPSNIVPPEEETQASEEHGAHGPRGSQDVGGAELAVRVWVPLSVCRRR